MAVIRAVVLLLLALAAPARADTWKPTAFAVEVHGTGRPVLLIPGLGCPSSVWTAVSAHLVKLGYQTHAIAISGFAGRPAIDRPISAAVRDDLVHYIAAHHLDHPIVIGHSLGGFIAYWLAATAPDAVGPVVIADASPDMFADSDPQSIAASLAHWRALSAKEFAVAVAQYFGGMANDRALIDPVIARVAASDRRAFADALDEMAHTDIRKQMKHVTAPVLVVIAGDSSKSFIQAVADQTAPIKEHAQLVLANTHHFVFFDDPVGFHAAVDPFLASHQ